MTIKSLLKQMSMKDQISVCISQMIKGGTVEQELYVDRADRIPEELAARTITEWYPISWDGYDIHIYVKGERK